MKYFPPLRGLRLSIGFSTFFLAPLDYQYIFFTLLGGLDYQYIFSTLAPVLESKAFPFPPLGYKKAHPRHTVKGGFAAAVGGLPLTIWRGRAIQPTSGRKGGLFAPLPRPHFLPCSRCSRSLIFLHPL